MAVLNQGILNIVFCDFMKTIEVPADINKEEKIGILLPKFEQHVNQLISELKGILPPPPPPEPKVYRNVDPNVDSSQVRQVQQTRRHMRSRMPFIFRRTIRRPRRWWGSR